jgi:signal transduction histidine kinase
MARWRPSTVRSQLTLLATVLAALVLAVSAVALIAVQQRVLTRGIDEALIQRADNIEGDVSSGVFGRQLPMEGDPEDSFLQLVSSSGALIASSANATHVPPATGALTPGSSQVVRTVRGISLSHREFRVLSRSIGSPRGPNTLIVAKNLDDVNESVRILASSLAIAIPLVTALLGLLVWWLTGRVLAPVESIRSAVATIHGADLDVRVPIPRSDDEISRLAHTMNAMLDRVQEATHRQRRFVADASHELRTPLTRLRSSLELGIDHPETIDSVDVWRGLLDDTTDLQKLVDDLLFLARSEAGVFERPSTPVDLDDLVLEEVRELRDRGRVHVDASGVSAARILGDPHQLTRVIRNLSSNAERHARTQVTFELRERGDRSELVVADDGPGIPTEHRDTVFKRFSRLDQARSRDAGGAGLGLAIVHDIVTRHDGRVSIAAQNGDGARFVVSFPRAQ